MYYHSLSNNGTWGVVAYDTLSSSGLIETGINARLGFGFKGQIAALEVFEEVITADNKAVSEAVMEYDFGIFA